jgi:hypothetical protein
MICRDWNNSRTESADTNYLPAPTIGVRTKEGVMNTDKQPVAVPTDDDDAYFTRYRVGSGFWELDRNLPRWARRSNPIVRRHLGGFLGAPLPQVDVLLRLFLVQVVVVAVSLVIPAVLEITALMGLVSMFVMPVLLGMYAWALFTIGRSAANTIMSEKQSQGLDTLRTTPLTLRSIMLSKIAAGLWQQAVNLDTVILGAAVFSLPPITIELATFYPPDVFVIESRLLISIGLGVTILRLIAEPLMIGALGVLAGAVADMRAAAITWVTLLGAAYFVLLNLPRMLTLTWGQRLLIESVLPLALPVLITLSALHIARRTLLRD